ncbi:MAG: hypothetical protein AAF665_06540 [Pseudomonadota bacterium]
MSIELFAIGSSGLALVALVLMVATRTRAASIRIPVKDTQTKD